MATVRDETYALSSHFSPLIGILCMDIAESLANIYGKHYKSYISAAYVKYLEAEGARVVPVW